MGVSLQSLDRPGTDNPGVYAWHAENTASQNKTQKLTSYCADFPRINHIVSTA